MRAVHVEPLLPRAFGGSSTTIFGETLTCRVGAELTGGAYSLFEVVTPPGGGPPPHVQHREDECLYVLEGRFEVHVDDLTVSAEAGSLSYIPKGSLHHHTNVGPGWGRLLVSRTPGGPHEEFLRGVRGLAGEAEVASLAATFGIEIVRKRR